MNRQQKREKNCVYLNISIREKRTHHLIDVYMLITKVGKRARGENKKERKRAKDEEAGETGNGKNQIYN